MRLRAFAVSAAPLALACSLDLAGTADLAVDAAASDATFLPDAAHDVTFPSDAGSVADSASSDDCGVTVAAAGVVNAYRAAAPKTVDGNLDDWGCEAPLVVDVAHAGFVHGASDAGVSAALRIEWDATRLYFAFDVTDPALDGDSANTVANDAVEVYLSANGRSTTGTYGPSDRQFTVDWRGVVQAWSYPGGQGPLPSGVNAAARATARGYAVELAIPASALMAADFTLGARLGFDTQIDDGVGQPNVLVWDLEQSAPCGCDAGTCCCGQPSDLPWCDTRRFGALTLR